MKNTTLIIIVFSLFIATLFNTGMAEVPGDSWKKVLEEAREGGYQLITPEEIEKEYLKDSSSLYFVDTRQEWEYNVQHIKGAVNLPVNPGWWYQYSPGAKSEIRKLLDHKGDKKVIFY